jgi:hypothetical protein
LHHDRRTRRHPPATAAKTTTNTDDGIEYREVSPGKGWVEGELLLPVLLPLLEMPKPPAITSPIGVLEGPEEASASVLGLGTTTKLEPVFVASGVRIDAGDMVTSVATVRTEVPPVPVEVLITVVVETIGGKVSPCRGSFDPSSSGTLAGVFVGLGFAALLDDAAAVVLSVSGSCTGSAPREVDCAVVDGGLVGSADVVGSVEDVGDLDVALSRVVLVSVRNCIVSCAPTGQFAQLVAQYWTAASSALPAGGFDSPAPT